MALRKSSQRSSSQRTRSARKSDKLDKAIQGAVEADDALEAVQTAAKQERERERAQELERADLAEIRSLLRQRILSLLRKDGTIRGSTLQEIVRFLRDYDSFGGNKAYGQFRKGRLSNPDAFGGSEAEHQAHLSRLTELIEVADLPFPSPRPPFDTPNHSQDGPRESLEGPVARLAGEATVDQPDKERPWQLLEIRE